MRSRPVRDSQILSQVPGLGTTVILLRVLKGEDIVLMVKLAGSRTATWTIRSLEEETAIPRSAIQRALERLAHAGLLDPSSRTVRVAQAEEFLIYGLRYVFPARLGGETRGVKAAWASEPLASRLSGNDVLPPVWPAAHGDVRGLELKPLHRAVIEAAAADPQLGPRLALVDAIRAGDARVRHVAAELLREHLADRVA